MTTTTLPELPAELIEWRWQISESGNHRLMTSDLTWSTKWYSRPDKAIAEAKRWVLSQPRPKPVEQEPTVQAIDAAVRDDPAAIVEIAGVVMMTADEARLAVASFRDYLSSAEHYADRCRAVLLDMYEREAWRALGYASWRACAIDELGLSQAHVYRLLGAAQMERDIAPALADFSQVENLPEFSLRPLAQLDTPAERQQAARQAIDAAGGKAPTAKQVQAAVEAIKPPAPAPFLDTLPPGYFEQIQARFAALGWRLEAEDSGRFAMYPPAPHPGIGNANWPGVIDRLATMEQRDTARAAAIPDAPRCACGAVATDRRNIGGCQENRCAACAAREEEYDLRAQLGGQYQSCYTNLDGAWHSIVWAGTGAAGNYTYDEALSLLHASRSPGGRLRAAGARAEALGAIVDYLSQRADDRVKVVPPAGHNQHVIWCDAGELAARCAAWEGVAATAAAESRAHYARGVAGMVPISTPDSLDPADIWQELIQLLAAHPAALLTAARAALDSLADDAALSTEAYEDLAYRIGAAQRALADLDAVAP
jgi:hypothetical protein